LKILSKGIIPLTIAGLTALLSMLTGFISGVNPLMIILRGLITAFLAAFFVLLVEWLIKSFLPELSNLNSKDSEQPGQPETPGGRVNIVMPDEMPQPAVVAREAAAESNGAGENGGDDDDVEELTSLDENQSENEIAESTESVHNNKPEEPDIAAAAAESLDTLPNLDSLEINIGSSSEQVAAVEPMDSVTPPPSSGGSGVDLGENSDPEIIAKAVKTVLARDQMK
jgi:hypothetical protein